MLPRSCCCVGGRACESDVCGRFAFFAPPHALAEYFGVAEVPSLTPRYNVAPTQLVAAIRGDAEGRRRIAMLRWGLVPYWAKDPSIGNRLINARAETVDSKPAFREAFSRRRCLVPASGFYEWGETPLGKRPYFVSLADGGPMGLAALWESWRRGTESVESCAIITTDANALLASVHGRMPVLLSSQDSESWLSRETSVEDALGLLKPAPSGDFQLWRVSRRVNDPGNDGPDLVAPLPHPE